MAKKRGRPTMPREGKMQILVHVPREIGLAWKALIAGRGQSLDAGGEAALRFALEAAKNEKQS